ncbi:MAG: cyclic nucleotide-binding domain-containing protein [Chloroflexota bacterium]|nr:cyclic nucleotide-binding domain-containing protein [Chloroflexota bacterium]
MQPQFDVVDTIASLSLFADLSRAQLEAVTHVFEEASFGQGERILRQGLSGSNFFVILDGDVAIRIDGQDRATLSRGDFFGELSVLLSEPPVADVVALRPLRCLVLPGSELETFLVTYPRVAYRMVQALARRLRAANRWRS